MPFPDGEICELRGFCLDQLLSRVWKPAEKTPFFYHHVKEKMRSETVGFWGVPQNFQRDIVINWGLDSSFQTIPTGVHQWRMDEHFAAFWAHRRFEPATKSNREDVSIGWPNIQDNGHLDHLAQPGVGNPKALWFHSRMLQPFGVSWGCPRVRDPLQNDFNPWNLCWLSPNWSQH